MNYLHIHLYNKPKMAPELHGVQLQCLIYEDNRAGSSHGQGSLVFEDFAGQVIHDNRTCKVCD